MGDTERPSTCENPEADCYRDPTRYVEWAEDYTSDTPLVEVWLCNPCAKILKRGTVISPNELDVGRSVDKSANTTESDGGAN